MTTERPLELLHMDIFGPVSYISIGDNKYGFVIVDDYSRFTWVFFCVKKVKCKISSRSLQEEPKMSLMSKSRELEVIMGRSSRIPTLKSFLMKKESSMSFWFHTLHNKMVLWRGRTEHS